MSLPQSNTPTNLLLLSVALFVAGAGVNGPKTMCGLEVRERFPVRNATLDGSNANPKRYFRVIGVGLSRGAAWATWAAGCFGCRLSFDACASIIRRLGWYVSTVKLYGVLVAAYYAKDFIVDWVVACSGV